MNYKLKGKQEYEGDIVKLIASNRGIDNLREFLNPTEDVLHSPYLMDNMEEGFNKLMFHVNKGSRIHWIVDSDVDGYTSFAQGYDYLKRMGVRNMTWNIHKGKGHGIVLEDLKEFDYDLLIVTDGGTSDVRQQEILIKEGKDILILDHHKLEVNTNKKVELENQKIREELISMGKLTIINPQLDNYPNKNLSGAGVVYKFLQVMDEKLGLNYADDYLDLMALGMIADMMEIKDLETKYLIMKGINPENIKNDFIKSLINKQSFSLGQGDLTYKKVGWSIAPLINAMIRVGEFKDKKDLVRAFLEPMDLVPYRKNSKTEEVMVRLCDDMARRCVNAHSKQNRDKKTHIEFSEDNIERLDSPVVLLRGIEGSLKGLLGNTINKKYNRPCLIVEEKVKNNEVVLTGSARGYQYSQIDDFMKVCLDSNCFNFCAGHSNAFGVEIKESKLNDFYSYLENKGYDSNAECYYPVDAVLYPRQMNDVIVKDIESISSHFGRGFEEPKFFIKNLESTPANTEVTDKVVRITFNGIVYVLFRPSENDIDTFKKSNIRINVVGDTSVNVWNGKKTYQFIISDYDVVEEIDEIDSLF